MDLRWVKNYWAKLTNKKAYRRLTSVGKHKSLLFRPRSFAVRSWRLIEFWGIKICKTIVNIKWTAAIVASRFWTYQTNWGSSWGYFIKILGIAQTIKGMWIRDWRIEDLHNWFKVKDCSLYSCLGRCYWQETGRIYK